MVGLVFVVFDDRLYYLTIDYYLIIRALILCANFIKNMRINIYEILVKYSKICYIICNKFARYYNHIFLNFNFLVKIQLNLSKQHLTNSNKFTRYYNHIF